MHRHNLCNSVLLEKGCYQFPAATRPPDGIYEDDRAHNKVAFVDVLRWASVGFRLIMRTTQSK